MPSTEHQQRSLSFWGARVSDSQTRMATIESNRARMYADSPQYTGLFGGQYGQQRLNDWQRNGKGPESAVAFLNRTKTWLNNGHLEAHLDADTFAAVLADFRAAEAEVTGYSHDQLRSDLSGRRSGTNVSQFPDASGRGQLLGNRAWGGQQSVQANGSIALGAESASDGIPKASNVAVGQVLRQQEAQEQAARQAHTAAIRGASGAGFIGVDR
jgi:hypothetical protein